MAAARGVAAMAARGFAIHHRPAEFEKGKQPSLGRTVKKTFQRSHSRANGALEVVMS